jgi:hypothetical protein
LPIDDSLDVTSALSDTRELDAALTELGASPGRSSIGPARQA